MSQDDSHSDILDLRLLNLAREQIYVRNLSLTIDKRLVDKVPEGLATRTNMYAYSDGFKKLNIECYADMLSEIGLDVLGAMYLYLPENASKDMNIPFKVETYRNGILQYGTVEDLINNPEKFIGCFISDTDDNVDTHARLKTEEYEEVLSGCKIKATNYNASRFNSWDKKDKFRILCLILYKEGKFKTVAFAIYNGIVRVHNNETLLRDDTTSTTFLTVNSNSDIIHKAVGINFNKKERITVANMLANSNLKYWGNKVTISKLLVKLGKVKNRMELDDKLHRLASAGLTAGAIVTYPFRMILGY